MIKLVIETTYINIESICHFECKLIISAYCPKCPVLSISRFRKTQLGFFFLFWLKWHQSDTSFESRLYLTVKLGIPQVTANNYKTHLYFLQNIQSNTTHSWFLDPWNREKSLCNIRHRFSYTVRDSTYTD